MDLRGEMALDDRGEVPHPPPAEEKKDDAAADDDKAEKTEAKTDEKTEEKETNGDSEKTETKTESKTETKTETEAKTKSETKVEVKPEIKEDKTEEVDDTIKFTWDAENVQSMCDLSTEEILEKLEKCVDETCKDCKRLFREPEQEELVMYLHALRYNGPDWDFSSPMPDWAAEDWSDPFGKAS